MARIFNVLYLAVMAGTAVYANAADYCKTPCNSEIHTMCLYKVSIPIIINYLIYVTLAVILFTSIYIKSIYINLHIYIYIYIYISYLSQRSSQWEIFL